MLLRDLCVCPFPRRVRPDVQVLDVDVLRAADPQELRLDGSGVVPQPRRRKVNVEHRGVAPAGVFAAPPVLAAGGGEVEVVAVRAAELNYVLAAVGESSCFADCDAGFL